MSLLLDALKKAALEKEQGVRGSNQSQSAAIDLEDFDNTVKNNCAPKGFLETKKSIETSLSEIEQLGSTLKEHAAKQTSIKIGNEQDSTDQNDDFEVEEEFIDFSGISLDPEEFLPLDEPNVNEVNPDTHDQGPEPAGEQSHHISENQCENVEENTKLPDTLKPAVELNEPDIPCLNDPIVGLTEKASISNVAQSERGPHRPDPLIDSRENDIPDGDLAGVSTATEINTPANVNVTHVGDKRKKALAQRVEANRAAVIANRRRKFVVVSSLLVLSTLVVALYGYQSVGDYFIQQPIVVGSSQVGDIADNVRQLSFEPVNQQQASSRIASPIVEEEQESIDSVSGSKTGGYTDTAQGINQLPIATTSNHVIEAHPVVPVDITSTNEADKKPKAVFVQANSKDKIVAEQQNLKSKVNTPNTDRDHQKSNKPSIIEVGISSDQQVLRNSILAGYKAWSQGRWVEAQKHYDKALAIEPKHRDAILGAAATATELGHHEVALKYYQSRLSIAPKDEFALAGILNLVDLDLANESFESELKSLLADFPEAGHLHYLHGVLLSNREQWEPAQRSFFNAWKFDPSRADYVFNLAVSMDHLELVGEAIEFYSKANALAKASAHTFNPLQVEDRLAILRSAER